MYYNTFSYTNSTTDTSGLVEVRVNEIYNRVNRIEDETKELAARTSVQYVRREEFDSLKREMIKTQKQIEDFKEFIKELGFAKLLGGEA